MRSICLALCSLLAEAMLGCSSDAVIPTGDVGTGGAVPSESEVGGDGSGAGAVPVAMGARESGARPVTSAPIGAGASGGGGVFTPSGGRPSITGAGATTNAPGGFANGGFVSRGGFTSSGGFVSSSGSANASGGRPPASGGFVSSSGGRPPASGGTSSTGGVAAVCLPSIDHQCVGADLQVCRADGQGFRHAQSCATSELCNATLGICLPLPPVCVAGSTYCDGNTSVTCDATGQSMARNACPKLCIGSGTCADCDPAHAERDCPSSDPCQAATCDSGSYSCTYREKSVHDDCSMLPGYGGCTAGGCAGFCTDRGSCEPVVVIKANVNGKYVTITSDGYLLASAASKSDAARFAVHIDPRGASYEMAFYSMDVRSYVAVDSESVPLETGAGAIASPEVFTNLDGDGNYDPSNPITGVTMSFWSSDASKFVTAEDGGDSPLIANRDAVGPWEQFTLEFASP